MVEYLHPSLPLGSSRVITLPEDAVTLGGTWTAGYQNFAAGPDARIGLHYSARNVYVVLGGEGTATVDIDGVGTRAFPVLVGRPPSSPSAGRQLRVL